MVSRHYRDRIGGLLVNPTTSTGLPNEPVALTGCGMEVAPLAPPDLSESAAYAPVMAVTHAIRIWFVPMSNDTLAGPVVFL